MLAAKPRACAVAEGYDSDVTRDDAPRALAALRQPGLAPSKAAPAALAASPPAVATALPATRRSTRTQQKVAAQDDITAKMSCLQTAEPAVGGKMKRGAVPETQQESQGALQQLLSPPRLSL